MNVKVISAIATVVLLGALSVGLFVKNSLHVQVNAQQHPDAVAHQHAVAKSEAAGLKKLFSGATPDPKLMP